MLSVGKRDLLTGCVLTLLDAKWPPTDVVLVMWVKFSQMMYIMAICHVVTELKRLWQGIFREVISGMSGVFLSILAAKLF
jgi:hypothetical protein